MKSKTKATAKDKNKKVEAPAQAAVPEAAPGGPKMARNMPPGIFVVRSPSRGEFGEDGFASKSEAKKVRDLFNAACTVANSAADWHVARGPMHWRGVAAT